MTKEKEDLRSKAKEAQKKFNIEGQKLWIWKEFAVALVQSNRSVHLSDISANADALAAEWAVRQERASYFEEKKDKAWEAVHAAEQPATGENANEPNTILDGGLSSRADAWIAVTKVLDSVDPDWLTLAPTAQEAAGLAIGQLKSDLDKCKKRGKVPTHRD